MAEAYIIDATRSPTGKRRGSLQDVHAADLGAHVIKALVERNPIPDKDYDDVIFGAIDALGPLAGSPARTAANRPRAPARAATASDRGSP